MSTDESNVESNMETLDTPEKLKTWLSTHLDDSHSRYLLLNYKMEHIGDTWVVSAPPVPRSETLLGSSGPLVVADDGSVIKILTNYFLLTSRGASELYRDFDDLIADGSWRTDKYLVQLYPKIEHPPAPNPMDDADFVVWLKKDSSL